MKEILYFAAILALIAGLSVCSGNACTGGSSCLNYAVHYENGTVLNITENFTKFNWLNNSAMKFLQSIAFRTERWITAEELERELGGKKHLVITSDEPIEIQTLKGLNPDWPQGWTIITKKIAIKMEKEVLGEERIFTFHDIKSPEEGAPIRGWVSKAGAETIEI